MYVAAVAIELQAELTVCRRQCTNGEMKNRVIAFYSAHRNGLLAINSNGSRCTVPKSMGQNIKATKNLTELHSFGFDYIVKLK